MVSQDTPKNTMQSKGGLVSRMESGRCLYKR